MEWYNNVYRRHLLDMHIEDWDPAFLARFSPEAYVQNLVKAKVNYAMLYLQSHVGLCYFPTSVGSMHGAFAKQPDRMKRLAELCHENGIRVVGYYSLIYNTREHDKHPEWRLLTENGCSIRENGTSGGQPDLAFASPAQARYGHVCPNNEEYRSFVKTQIDEMAEYIDLDGFFFDMPFWPYAEYCHCAACRKRYFDLYGEELPTGVAPGSPELKRMVALKNEWMGEFVQDITDYVKAKYPRLSVEHNYASAVAASAESGCGTGVRDACDYVGGDLYGDLYYHSFACKFFYSETRNQPFENMISRCKPGLRVHTVTRSLDQLKTNIALAMAHHGATMLIDAIDPVGTMDERVYETFGEAFSFEIPYEKYFTGTPVADVGIIYDRLNRTSEHAGKRWFDLRRGCIETAKTLIGRHILCGCKGLNALSDYPVVVAPQLRYCDADEVVAYVEGGGTLVFTGTENPELLRRFLNATVVGDLDYDIVYFAPKGGDFLYFNEKYPLPYEGRCGEISGAVGEVLATVTLPYTKPDELRFASIHSNPPGIGTEIPAIMRRRYGSGTVLWFAGDIEAVDVDEYREIFTGLLAPYLPQTIETDAPEEVELTLFEDNEGLLLHAVVLDERIHSRSVPGFEVAVRSQAAPGRVILLPGGGELSFRYEDGYVRFTLPEVSIFATVRITR